MGNIFTGLILIFLDFTLNLGGSQIGLIPDFVGYIFMLRGLEEMEAESSNFIKVKPYVSGMIVYTGFLYLVDLIGISVSLGWITYVLALLSIVVSFYISYSIVMGIIDMEVKYNTSLNGNNLKSSWTLLLVFNLLSYGSLLVPFISIVFIIMSFIVAICFLCVFNNSKNLYYDINK